MTSLLSRLRNHLARTRLLGSRVAVLAVSVRRSVALLDSFTASPRARLSLVVAHVDHGIRSDSGAVARAVAQLAERYELPFEAGELGLVQTPRNGRATGALWVLGEVQRRTVRATW